MAVEIREIVIRATIPANTEGENQPTTASHDTGMDTIVQECVRQVLSILKKQEER